MRAAARRRVGRYSYQAEAVVTAWACDHLHRTERGALECARKYLRIAPTNDD